MKKKFKLWRRPKYADSIHSKEFRKMENKTKEELANEIFDKYYDPGESIGFLQGFDAAKSMIIKFLQQKQMGYGEAFFFKISEIEEIGEQKWAKQDD